MRHNSVIIIRSIDTEIFNKEVGKDPAADKVFLILLEVNMNESIVKVRILITIVNHIRKIIEI